MGKARTLENTKGRSAGRVSFAGIPRRVMQCKDFPKLRPSSVVILLWLAFQYKGKNNGYLSATRSEAKDWGIGGSDTLARGLDQLLELRFVVQTQQGRFMNPGGTPNLYALSWEPIDGRQDKPLEVEPTRTPPRTDWERVKNRSP